MAYLNRYSFIGNLTKAPDLRFQPTVEKQALCIIHVAINRSSRDENGEKKIRTTYINDIEVWGHNGEMCAGILTAGSTVFVEGRIEVDQWEDKQSGKKRSRLKVIAENVQFLRIKRPEDGSRINSPSESASDAPTEAPERKTRRRTANLARSEP
jgi:single-strand DNA-binding protein